MTLKIRTDVPPPTPEPFSSEAVRACFKQIRAALGLPPPPDPNATTLVFPVLGITNTGKTTFVDTARESLGVGMVEIGKEMRRRHPPEYFAGRGAMADTEAEVWQIFDAQIAAATAEGCTRILLDGLPRMAGQVRELCARLPSAQFRPILLHADQAVLNSRAAARARTPEDLSLSLRRMSNDREQLYDVLYDMLSTGRWRAPVAFDTANPEWMPLALSYIERCRA